MQAPPPPAPPARVAYVHGRATWSMDADGGDRRRLVAEAFEPAWSPDGTRIAAYRKRAIVTFAADGSDVRTVVRGAVGEPAWSPDGTQIAYATSRGSQSTIAVVPATGGAGRVVARHAGADTYAWQPTWRPDGAALAYTVTDDDTADAEVRVVGVDGTGDRRLLAHAEHPSFSPDGTRIAFAATRGARGRSCGEDECIPNADVAVAAADGTGQQIVLRTRTDEDDPAWSPDGTRLLFSSTRNTGRDEGSLREVHSMAPDGSCLTWLTNGNRESEQPVAGPGRAAPLSCATDRPPLIDGLRIGRLSRSLWLGPVYRNALATAAGPGGFRYGDCAAFTATHCTPPFLLSEADACDPRAVSYVARRLVDLHRVGRAVVGDVHGDAGRNVLVDGRLVYVEVGRGRTSRRFAERVARALHRVDGAGVGAARLPRRYRDRLPARVRRLVRPC